MLRTWYCSLAVAHEFNEEYFTHTQCKWHLVVAKRFSEKPWKPEWQRRESRASVFRIVCRHKAACSKWPRQDFGTRSRHRKRSKLEADRPALEHQSELFGCGMYVKIKSLGGVVSGSLSAVSKPNFARKYSLENSWWDLQDFHAFAPLKPQYFRRNR